ncbi:hypothetical protein BC938DRAFT_481150 [Jimgerdemannia flammicorona]|uniref:Uncharacterized protein n=1 Tax=Jimgerdemannia flammicorona TaxID=994334 RepID=A0A433QWY3_9FUNG|nr:hypothetical protein BC938DRAFT_481150 [Jimgerdemannia flammicorona]
MDRGIEEQRGVFELSHPPRFHFCFNQHPLQGSQRADVRLLPRLLVGVCDDSVPTYIYVGRTLIVSELDVKSIIPTLYELKDGKRTAQKYDKLRSKLIDRVHNSAFDMLHKEFTNVPSQVIHSKITELLNDAEFLTHVQSLPNGLTFYLPIEVEQEMIDKIIKTIKY